MTPRFSFFFFLSAKAEKSHYAQVSIPDLPDIPFSHLRRESGQAPEAGSVMDERDQDVMV